MKSSAGALWMVIEGMPGQSVGMRYVVPPGLWQCPAGQTGGGRGSVAAGQAFTFLAQCGHCCAAAPAALGLVGLVLPPDGPCFFAGAQGGGSVALSAGRPVLVHAAGHSVAAPHADRARIWFVGLGTGAIANACAWWRAKFHNRPLHARRDNGW